MTYGIKVSREGVDASTSAATGFVMNSQWATIKVLMSGPTSATVNGSSSTSVTGTTNAGFYPLVLLFAELTPDSGRWYASPFQSISGENTYFSGDLDDSYVAQNSFVFKLINNTASSKTVDIYYYVIGETGV